MKPAWHTEAKALRAQGMTFREISELLGRSISTVEAAIADRDDTARKRAWASNPANRIPCAICGGPTAHTPGQGRNRGIGRRPEGEEARCRACWEADEAARVAERAHRIEGWWAEGVSHREIAARLGWSEGHMSVQMNRLRAKGFDLPLRYAGWDPEVVAETVRLYRSGLSTAQVGERLGVSSRTVGYRLKKAGCPRRTRSEAQHLRHSTERTT